MMRLTRRRLVRLEAATRATERLRYVWVREGEPIPGAGPGERLTIVRWSRETDPADPLAATSGEEREETAASGCQ